MKPSKVTFASKHIGVEANLNKYRNDPDISEKYSREQLEVDVLHAIDVLREVYSDNYYLRSQIKELQARISKRDLEEMY